MSTVLQTNQPGPVAFMESTLTSRMASMCIQRPDPDGEWQTTVTKNLKGSRCKSSGKRNSGEPSRTGESDADNPRPASRKKDEISRRNDNNKINGTTELTERNKRSLENKGKTVDTVGESRRKTSDNKVRINKDRESLDVVAAEESRKKRASERNRCNKLVAEVVVAEDEERRTQDNRSKKTHAHRESNRLSNGEHKSSDAERPSHKGHHKRSSRTQSVTEIENDKNRYQAADEAKKTTSSPKHTTKQDSEKVSRKDHHKKSGSEKRKENSSGIDESKKSNDAKPKENSVATMKGGPRKKGAIDGQESNNVEKGPPAADKTRLKLRNIISSKAIREPISKNKNPGKLPNDIINRIPLAVSNYNDLPSTSGAAGGFTTSCTTSSEQRDNGGLFCSKTEDRGYLDLLDDNKEDKANSYRFVYSIAHELLMERQGHARTNGQDLSEENVRSVGPMSSGSSLPYLSPESDAIYSPEANAPCSSRDLSISDSPVIEPSEPCLNSHSADMPTLNPMFVPLPQTDLIPAYEPQTFPNIPTTTVGQVPVSEVSLPSETWASPISSSYLSSITNTDVGQSETSIYVQQMYMPDDNHPEYFEQTAPPLVYSPETNPSHVSTHGSDHSPGVFSASPASEDVYLPQNTLHDGMSSSVGFRRDLMDED